MGPSHAISGVAGWVGLCAGSALLGHDPSGSTILLGAGVAAGFALLPDLDHPGSTVSRSLGPLTRVASRAVSFVADFVQDVTCPCCTDENTVSHRGLSHTFAASLADGALVALACWRLGRPAAAIVVGLAVALAVLGVFRSGWAALGVGSTCGALLFELGASGGWWWLGVPAGFGVLAHIAGDGLTISRVPALWPARIRGCRWYMVGSPRWLRFRTGGRRERWVVVPLMLATLAGSCWVLVA